MQFFTEGLYILYRRNSLQSERERESERQKPQIDVHCVSHTVSWTETARQEEAVRRIMNIANVAAAAHFVLMCEMFIVDCRNTRFH